MIRSKKGKGDRLYGRLSSKVSGLLEESSNLPGSINYEMGYSREIKSGVGELPWNTIPTSHRVKLADAKRRRSDQTEQGPSDHTTLDLQP